VRLVQHIEKNYRPGRLRFIPVIVRSRMFQFLLLFRITLRITARKKLADRFFSRLYFQVCLYSNCAAGRRIGKFWFDTWRRRENFFLPTEFKSHSSLQWVICFLVPGLKQPGSELDNLNPSGWEFKKVRGYTNISLACLLCAKGLNFIPYNYSQSFSFIRLQIPPHTLIFTFLVIYLSSVPPHISIFTHPLIHLFSHSSTKLIFISLRIY